MAIEPEVPVSVDNQMGNGIIRILLLLIVCAWSAHVTADELDVDVTIENLDFRQPKVTVSYDGKSRELDIASDSEIEINGRKTDYRSMLPGDHAKVTYNKERKLVTRIAIQRELMAPAEKLAEGWEEIDPRLIFLMIRLANVEATLEAIEKATERKGVRVVTVERDAKRADRANEDMDRNAGGPLKWSQFYGMTAEKFFYHPTDRNSSYHTVTVLNQQGYQADNKVGGGVPSSQGLPVNQRPPQFDYIYRANEKARGRAEGEILELRGKLDQLEARRQRLEAEQAGLWVEIAFHSMLHFDLDKNPIYRFEPLMLASDTDSRNRTETLKATTEFMALVLSIIKEADRDQPGTFTRIKPAVAKSRQSMMDAYLRLAVDVTDKKSSFGRFYALAKRIDEVASNLTDSYVVAMEGDSSKARMRKDLFRLQLQQSLLSYAQIVLAMDEMVKELESGYGYKPDTNRLISYSSVTSFEPTSSKVLLSPRTDGRQPRRISDWNLNGDNKGSSNWSVYGELVTLRRPGANLESKESFKDFELQLEFRLPPKTNSGVFLRGRYEVQLLDSLWRFPNGREEQPNGKCGAIYGQFAPLKDMYRGANTWNTLDIRLVDDLVTVRMNGETIVDSIVLTKRTDANKSHESVQSPGPIVLQSHGTSTGVQFRNIRITPID